MKHSHIVLYNLYSIKFVALINTHSLLTFLQVKIPQQFRLA